jgi:hypothetical protein
MGIKNLDRRFVEIGKIKIGGKNPNKEYKGKDGKMHRHPVKFDHFVITGMEKDDKDNFIPDSEITKLLGEKPKFLDILLLTDDVDKNFMTAYQLYAGSKCLCRGDGETAKRRITRDENGNPLPEPIYKEVACENFTCEYYISGKCKPNGILSCIIPKTNKIGGVYKYRTQSWNSIINITSSLEAIKIMTGGVLCGIPLRMELIDKKTESHGTIKVVNIVFNGDMKEIQKLGLQQQRLRLTGVTSIETIEEDLIPDQILEDRDNPADIQDEFQPDNNEIDTQESGELDIF